jgi:hypothetical protein
LFRIAGTCVPAGIATPEVLALAELSVEVELLAPALPAVELCFPWWDTAVLVEVLVELFELALTPDWEAETEVSDWADPEVWVLPEVCAASEVANTAKLIQNRTDFIGIFS